MPTASLDDFLPAETEAPALGPIASDLVGGAGADYLSPEYRAMGRRNRRLALECLERGDHRQAPEKAWAAFAQAVKIASAGRGIPARLHTPIVSVAQAFTELASDVDPCASERLQHGLTTARSLHMHLRENDLSPGLVASHVAEVLEALDVLDAMTGSNPA